MYAINDLITKSSVGNFRDPQKITRGLARIDAGLEQCLYIEISISKGLRLPATTTRCSGECSRRLGNFVVATGRRNRYAAIELCRPLVEHPRMGGSSRRNRAPQRNGEVVICRSRYFAPQVESLLEISKPAAGMDACNPGNGRRDDHELEEARKEAYLRKV